MWRGSEDRRGRACTIERLRVQKKREREKNVCNVMFWLYAIEPMSFGQISNVKRTHERRSYPFKDASITRIIIITSYSVWGHGREGQHAHSIENHHIDADCINRFESDYKFVEPALSFILLTRKHKLSHSFLLSFLQIRFHPVFSSSLTRYVIHQITRLNGRNSISLLFTARAQIVLQ